MEGEQNKLQLGKGVAFVKSQLRRLPASDDLWEADFMWALSPVDPKATVWMGLVVQPDGGVVAERMVEQPPTVNDMARLLADAMRRPLDGEARRPRTLRLRKRQEWAELHPHLTQLGIKVIAAPALPKWGQVFKQMQREMAKDWPDPPRSPLEAEYPTVARFVQGQGWIEIGDHEGEGWVVRAIDYGGLVFETRKARSLTQAMAALEKGIAKFNGEDG